ncbi:MAG TPA: MBL fold metallo-hydrolase [Steroidobacteraceae bacterium]|nr:MBL fold metallo-hydrolase [Steroidobacteraceae bacterium]
MKRVVRGITCIAVLGFAGCAADAPSSKPQQSQVVAPPRTEALVQEGTTIRLARHTWVIPDDADVPLVPVVGIVVGSKATLVIDPGLGKRNGEAVRREVAKISRNSQIYLASTHFHPEHTLGILGFPESAQYVNSVVQEAESVESSARMITAFSARSPLTAELLQGATPRKAAITFDKEYTLDLGGVRVHFLVVGPTHTRGDTVFFIEEDRVLFSGDVVMNTSFLAASPGSSMKAWLAAFDSLERMKPKFIAPAHGSVGNGTLIEQNRAVMTRIKTRTLALKAENRSSDEAAKTVQEELRAEHPKWPRSNGIEAAAKSAYNEN